MKVGIEDLGSEKTMEANPEYRTDYKTIGEAYIGIISEFVRAVENNKDSMVVKGAEGKDWN
ncbi:MAG: hypothetical protein Nk1A_8620 [Endomicrobiia bacterium]|nr:MAG: hypothetical protein Nk1A_8620 [Endomicrobiia bacterium]